MPFQMPCKFKPLCPDLLRDAREITKHLSVRDLVGTADVQCRPEHSGVAPIQAFLKTLSDSSCLATI